MSIMAQEFIAMMRRSALSVASSKPEPKLGFITAYDPQTYAVRVRLEPESAANELTGAPGGVVETNWIPLARPFGGNGWGMVSPPKASPRAPYGDMCVVIPTDGGPGVAISGFYNDIERTPIAGTTYPSADASAVPATGAMPSWGEFWLTGPKGNYVRILNDGSVVIFGSDGSFITVNPSNDKSVTVSSSTGSFVTLLASGNVIVRNSSTTALNLTGGLATLGGSIDTTNGGVVTKQDLQTAINAVMVFVNLRQAGVTASTPPTATASATVQISH